MKQTIKMNTEEKTINYPAILWVYDKVNDEWIDETIVNYKDDIIDRINYLVAQGVITSDFSEFIFYVGNEYKVLSEAVDLKIKEKD